MKNGVFLKNGVLYFFSFEPLSGFDSPVDQTNNYVKRRSSSHFQLGRSATLRDCKSIFSYFSTIITANSSRCIFKLSVNFMPTTKQYVSAIALARAFVYTIGRSNPPGGSKIKKK